MTVDNAISEKHINKGCFLHTIINKNKIHRVGMRGPSNKFDK